MRSARLFFAIALASLSAAVPVASASAAVWSAVRPAAGSLTSNVWAGWMDRANANVQIYDVAARFTVPRVTCTHRGSDAYFWVGLDGWGNATVEQTGVAAVCEHTSSGNKPVYVDWYEMYPKRGVVVHPVARGDTIIASVSYDSRNGQYYLQISDRTRPGASFSTHKSCPRGHTCRKAMAEVIAEDPGGGVKKGVYLANFGTVHFSEAEVISRNGTVGSLEGNNLWSANKITMKYKSTLMAQPSGRSDHYTAFSVTFKNKG
jgi:Peptidase A4 family